MAAASRPARDPEGFDRDGKRTGPTLRACSACGVERGDHKFGCHIRESTFVKPLAMRERMLPVIWKFPVFGEHDAPSPARDRPPPAAQTWAAYARR